MNTMDGNMATTQNKATKTQVLKEHEPRKNKSVANQIKEKSSKNPFMENIQQMQATNPLVDLSSMPISECNTSYLGLPCIVVPIEPLKV